MNSVATAATAVPPLMPSPAMERPGCANHSGQPGDWACPRCRTAYCNSCMERKIVGSAEFLLCPACHSQCESLASPPPPRSFYAKLPGSFLYPVKGWALASLVTGALMLFFTELAARFSFRAWLVALAVMGYLATYLIKIANKSGDGDDVLPHWPSLSDGLVGTFFLFLVTTVLCFLPVAGYVAAMVWLDAPLKFLILPIYAACFVYPMAILRVAMFQSLSALHPVATLQSIFQAPTPYVVACILFSFILYAKAALGLVFLGVPWVGGLLESIVSFYFVIVQMRVLGLVYWAYEKRLGWFDDL